MNKFRGSKRQDFKLAAYGIRPSGMKPGPMVCGLEAPYTRVDCLVCGTVWNPDTDDRCPECDCPNWNPDTEEATV